MAELTLLFDGACPLCLREVDTLRRRDQGRGRLAFVDVDDPAYDPDRHGGITYAEAMGRMHALRNHHFEEAFTRGHLAGSVTASVPRSRRP